MLPVTLTAYHAAADQNLHRARASLCSAHVNHLPLMLLNICWIAPIQAVSCNYRAKQGLCSRGNKVSLWEGPQTSSCLYNRKCWRPFRSCWHACRRVHTPHMAPLGIPKACSDIQYFCSFTEYLLRHSSLRDTVSVIHWIPVSQWRFSHSHRQNNVGAEQQRSEAGIYKHPWCLYLALHHHSCPALYNLILINMHQRREVLQRALLPIPRQHTTTVH